MLSKALAIKRTRRASFYFAILLVVLLWAFPILWIILGSFKTDKLIISQSLNLLFQPTVVNYERIFSSHNFGKFLVNSLLVAIGTSVIVLASSFPASYSLSRFKTGGDMMSLGILITRIAPPAAVLMPFFIIFKNLSLLNNLWALILVNISLNMSFSLLLMRSFIDEIPVSIEEAATL